MRRIGLDISGLDTSFKAHVGRGIGRYVAELDKFFRQNRDTELRVDTFTHADLVGSPLINRGIDLIPLGRRTIKQQLLFPMQLDWGRLRGFDAVHFPAHMDGPSWCRQAVIITVLDLIPLVLADLYQAERPGWRFKAARWLEIQAIRNARLVLAISAHTARDVERVLGVPPERIVVTHLGVDESFFAAAALDRQLLCERYGVLPERPIMLYVGGIDPRKNWQALLTVMRQLISRLRSEQRPVPQLVLAGGIEGDHQFPKFQAALRELDLEADVVLAGFVPDADLPSLYSHSSVFCFPSLYEGFGLPPLEALAAGLPVVSSNRSCLPEVLGSAAVLVDPSDTAGLAEEVYRVLTDPEHAARLRAAGPPQARRFSWHNTGEATLAAYLRLFEAGGA